MGTRPHSVGTCVNSCGDAQHSIRGCTHWRRRTSRSTVVPISPLARTLSSSTVMPQTLVPSIDTTCSSVRHRQSSSRDQTAHVADALAQGAHTMPSHMTHGARCTWPYCNEGNDLPHRWVGSHLHGQAPPGRQRPQAQVCPSLRKTPMSIRCRLSCQHLLRCYCQARHLMMCM